MSNPTPRTWIEVSRAALLHNLEIVAKFAHPAKMGVVVKANAYGHGIREVATIFDQEATVYYLMVGAVEEGLELRATGCRKPILSLSYADTLLEEAIRANIMLTVASHEMLQRVEAAAKACKMSAAVQVKLETGMYRLGIDRNEIRSFAERLHQTEQVLCTGLYTHLSDTNNDDRTHTEQQRTEFAALAHIVDPEHKLLWHTTASGSLYLPPTCDLVRVGTMLYGSWKSERHRQRLQERIPGCELMPAMTWKARIIQCKQVPAGATIGYDCTYRTKEPLRIAILPIGYADGYQRILSNRGTVRIHDSYAPVVGIVSMNLMAVDVTHVPTAQTGNEVILVGPYEKITPYALAQELASNPNAITGVINPLIPRYVV